jgi:acyl-CoA reductase-like NAD-dependent aldehyde dehydrogenase
VFQSINPYTQTVIATHERELWPLLSGKVREAKTAFYAWKSLTFEERGALFLHLADYLKEHKEDLATLMTGEMGKIMAESRAEIEKCANQCVYYAIHAEKLLAPDVVPTEAQESTVSHEPIGVVLAIMPWNFPFWQVFRYAVPALMAGNTTLLKHAPNCFGIAKAIEKAFLDCGFPQGVFQAIVCDTDDIAQLISTDSVDMITLTGSERAGSAVAALAGKHIKKTVLELGGSDAFIVCADANIDKAVDAAIASRFMNAGQVCIAAKRLFVHQAVKAVFLEKFTQKAGQLKVGDPMEADTKIGPMARHDLAIQLYNQYAQAVEQGATVVLPMIVKNSLVSPAILEVSSLDNIVCTSETFGPLAVVLEFSDENEAIQLANASQYGLSAAIWSTDVSKAKQMAAKLEVGSVFINAVVRSDSRLPIGGIKKSGYGRELGEAGIKDFCYPKVTYIQ